MVNPSLYKRIETGQTKHEMLTFYEEAGLETGVTPCYFRLEDLKPGQPEITAFVRNTQGYKRTKVPFPRVIHNRAMYFNKESNARVASLAKQGTIIFNQCNRYGKLHIHKLLMQEDELRPHLPGTCEATVRSIKRMMSVYNALIIKPNSSSIGRGVMLLQRSETGGWRLTYPVNRQGGKLRILSFKQTLPLVLRRRIVNEAYLVQQRLPLATYKNRPFDLRVSVQRNGFGEWQITGIVGKVAAPNKFVTNVARGGSVYTLDELLREFPNLNPREVRHNIELLSLHIAITLSRCLPEMADLGLDIGITADGVPVFIECNGRDQRYSFGEGGLLDEWKSTYTNPIAYGRYLLDRPE
jgi:hypothetical protein